MPTVEEDELQEHYYLQDTEVMATVDVYSRRICDQSLALIKSIYLNVHTMPYGLRWICKTLSDLIY